MDKYHLGCFDQEFDEFVYLGGGVDVNPALYGEERGEHTQYPNKPRDANCYVLVDNAIAKNKPIIGVCRGLQFLSVYMGGKLHQHIGGTCSGNVTITYKFDRGNANVAVDHHQAAHLWSHSGETLVRHKYNSFIMPYIIYWERINAIAFQFHPEWSKEGAHLANQYIEEYIGIEGVF